MCVCVLWGRTLSPRDKILIAQIIGTELIFLFFLSDDCVINLKIRVADTNEN